MISSKFTSPRIADWVSDVSWSQIPPDVVEDTKLRILDIIGVMLAGKDFKIVSQVRRTTLPSGAEDGVRIFGSPGEVSLSNAALVLGVMATALEFDDTHLDGPVHSTGPVAAAAFPLATKLNISGRQLIEAVLIGNELSCRLGQVAPGMFHHCGFQATGAFGTFGAVYALSRILSLSPTQIVNAIGLGASMTASCMASFEDGTAPKSLHVGLDASSAMHAISLAQNGISGPAAVFEGRLGFFRSHVQQDYDFNFDALLRQLGTHWELLNIVSKAYPCSYQTHPYLDAALHMRAAHHLDPSNIAEVICLVPDDPLHVLVCEPVSEKIRPNNAWHARISMQHAVSEALVVGKLDKTAFSDDRLRDPRINDLAKRVKCVRSPKKASGSSTSIGEVRVHLHDGNEHDRQVQRMRGSRDNPMTSEEFVEKFRANVDGIIPANLADQTVASILQLQNVVNVAEIFTRLP